ncbi:MAG TPA: hypothetical protein VGP76_29750 [Planctomycetaceae bacterium]|nr:hypothetical protein [Planctomycetaceae bacterium]
MKLSPASCQFEPDLRDAATAHAKSVGYRTGRLTNSQTERNLSLALGQPAQPGSKVDANRGQFGRRRLPRFAQEFPRPKLAGPAAQIGRHHAESKPALGHGGHNVPAVAAGSDGPAGPDAVRRIARQSRGVSESDSLATHQVRKENERLCESVVDSRLTNRRWRMPEGKTQLLSDPRNHCDKSNVVVRGNWL